ncbi:hypothetical protein F938_00814 [Acinetobacter bereziniae LMG 1003 = CIP 70.12]|uniref:Uncharacterized protein n=1 Tax=Acinetobacter bereziniae LMG 1003 = CIP 70.12 TaxID=981324 RepID=N9EYV2_ACIBZ|nr:hypothetical protein [Acinetobacter bereziniae]ENW00170.1 hypothetical protein F938_00814 [Acinetobacter bereziniae LMG 1003 = CIP 70.12]MBJ8474361.1 hypothetical protein [Acinetobacter bereziniae]
MCGGGLGKVFSTVTDAIGLTNTKQASQGYDAQAAETDAKNAAQEAQNQAKAQRKKRQASEVLTSTDQNQKKTTLGGG